MVAAVDAVDTLTALTGTSASYGWTKASVANRYQRRGQAVADVHVYVNRPAEKEGAGFEDLEQALRKLEHVSDVEVNSPGNVVAVAFEGGQAQQQEIVRTVEEAGYEVSRLSIRSNFPEERNLWDI
jgi:copper chaperone CopZ